MRFGKYKTFFWKYWVSLNFKGKLFFIYLLFSALLFIQFSITSIFTYGESKAFAQHVIHDVLNEKSAYKLLGSHKVGVQKSGVLGQFYPCMKSFRFSNDSALQTTAAKASKNSEDFYLVVDNQYEIDLLVRAYEAHKFTIKKLEGKPGHLFAMNCELTLLNQQHQGGTPVTFD